VVVTADGARRAAAAVAEDAAGRTGNGGLSLAQAQRGEGGGGDPSAEAAESVAAGETVGDIAGELVEIEGSGRSGRALARRRPACPYPERAGADPR
jgi:hypothetical protein